MSEQATPSIDAVTFRVGHFIVEPRACTVENGTGEIHIKPSAMNVLVYLAERPGVAVTNEALRDAFWRGSISAPNAVHKAVAELREALEDDPREPQYIETIPRRGYRLVAPVERLAEDGLLSLARNGDDTAVRSEDAAIEAPPPTVWWRARPLIVTLALFALLSTVVLWTRPANVETSNVADVSNEEPEAHCSCDLGVAVLPLRSITADKRVDELANQLAEGLRRSIADGFASRVSSRAKVANRSLDTESLSALGRSLGVDKVIDGELFVSGGVITATLVMHDVADAAATYRMQVDAPFPADADAQQDMLKHLMRVMPVYLSNGALEHMKSQGTDSAEAYLAFKEKSFEKAIELDPKFVGAYHALAVDLANRVDAQGSVAARQAAVAELDSIRARLAPLHAEAWIRYDIDQILLRWRGTTREEREARLREALAEVTTDGDRIVLYWYYANLLLSARLYDEAKLYLDATKSPSEWIIGSAYNRIMVKTDGPALAARDLHELFDARPDVSTALGEAVDYALAGDFDKAESALKNVERIDQTGLWAYSARLQVGAIRGQLPLGSDTLRAALADPRAAPLTRGIVRFMLGDVQGGIRDWEALDAPSLELIQQYIDSTETEFPQKVLADARYQSLLDRLDMGRRWTEYMRHSYEVMAPITGVKSEQPAPAIASAPQ